MKYPLLYPEETPLNNIRSHRGRGGEWRTLIYDANVISLVKCFDIKIINVAFISNGGSKPGQR